MPIFIKAKKSFDIYFDYKLISKYLCGSDSESKEALQKLNEVNFPAMIEAWPTITSFLKMNRNFYDILPGIFSPSLKNDARLFSDPNATPMQPIPNSQRRDVFPEAVAMKSKHHRS